MPQPTALTESQAGCYQKSHFYDHSRFVVVVVVVKARIGMTYDIIRSYTFNFFAVGGFIGISSRYNDWKMRNIV